MFDETNPAPETGAPATAKGPFGKLNWMKAGFLTADRLLTVSPNYAREVSGDADKGVELDHVIRAAGGIEGIVNGMDLTDWSPKTDKFLDVKFDKTTVVAGKAAAKAALQADVGLPVDPSVPVFGFIGRLEEQKGVDILLDAIPKFIEANKCQVWGVWCVHADQRIEASKCQLCLGVFICGPGCYGAGGWSGVSCASRGRAADMRACVFNRQGQGLARPLPLPCRSRSSSLLATPNPTPNPKPPDLYLQIHLHLTW